MTSKNLSIILLSIVIVASIGVSIFLFSTKYSFQENDPSISIEEVAEFSEDNISQADIDKLPGCITAFSELPKELEGVTKEAKNNLIDYRQNWQDLCLGKSERSLYPLWIEAEELTKTNYTNSGVYLGSGLCEENKMINGECATDITTYAPGIAGLYPEGMLQDFTQSQKLFVENTLLGTQEDKDFFSTYVSLHLENGNFRPWIEQTWDYGGCTLYGTYDWVGALDALDELSKKIKNAEYLKQINSSRNDLLEGVASYNYNSVDPSPRTYSICTCNKKEAVVGDLEKVIKYSVGNVFYKHASPQLNEIVNRIKDGTIQVFSDAERHCSGG